MIKIKVILIFIQGERGAGKTTFLRTALQYIPKEKEFSNVYSLAFIDPTLIETSQIFLLEIINELSKFITKKLKCSYIDTDKHQKLHSYLEQINDGIHLLSDQEKGKVNWNIDKALRETDSGQALEKQLHKLIDFISEETKISHFIIAIDDVDTDTKKAYEVLESIRCYLTSPKLIILLSGDLNLYRHIVKNKKQKELNLSPENIENNNSMLLELVEQYLIKILPVTQRVNLKNIHSLLSNNTIEIEHKSIENNTADIKSIFEYILSNSLYIRKNHLSSYIDFILQQPVRTVLQLLKSILDYSIKEQDKKIKIKDSSNQDIFNSYKLKEYIYNAFATNLIEENINLENLYQDIPDINLISGDIFKLLHKNNELETGFYLRPDSTLEYKTFNATKLFLSFTLSTLLNKDKNKFSISNAIKFILSSGASSTIYGTYIANNLSPGKTQEHYMKYIGLTRTERIRSLANHLNPCIFSQYNTSSNKKGSVGGVIRTPRAVEKANFDEESFPTPAKERIKKLSQLSTEYNNNIETDNITDFISLVTILMSASSVVISPETRDYISAYSFLASIAEIMEKNTDIDKFINSLSNPLNYLFPDFLNNSSSKPTDDIINEDEEDKENEDKKNEDKKNEDNKNKEDNNLTILSKGINEWIEIINDLEMKISPLMVGKIWTRIYYSLNQVSETSESSKENKLLLGELFSRFIWTIINSILIEEYYYSLSNENTSGSKNAPIPRNTDTSLSILAQNLQRIDDIKNFPMTYTFLTCPLVWPFILIDGDSDSNSIKEIISSNLPTKYNKLVEILNKIYSNQSKILIISRLPILGKFKPQKK